MAIYKLVCPGIFEDWIEARDLQEAISKAQEEGRGLPRSELWQRNALIAVIRTPEPTSLPS